MKSAILGMYGLLAAALGSQASAAAFSGTIQPGDFSSTFAFSSYGPPVRVQLIGDFSGIGGVVRPIAEYSFKAEDPGSPGGVYYEIFDRMPTAEDPIGPAGIDTIYSAAENSFCDPLGAYGFCPYEEFVELEIEGFNSGGPVNFILKTTVLPEPSTWVMTILGFGLAGGALRRCGLAAGSI